MVNVADFKLGFFSHVPTQP